LTELSKKAVKDETTKPKPHVVIGEVVGVVKAIPGNFNCDVCGISTTSQTCYDAVSFNFIHTYNMMIETWLFLFCNSTLFRKNTKENNRRKEAVVMVVKN
jgi:hypothetical protein